MDRDRWLECRMHGPKGDIEYAVGGSDVATIFGISPWTTPLELWRIKKGLMKPSTSTNEDQKEMGQLLEPIVAHWYGKKTGFKVIDDTNMYQHADHDYALVNIDYRFEEPSGQPGILECKTTTYHKAYDWEDGALPIYYEFQLRYILAVMDEQFGDFACLWGNNPNDDMATLRLERDQFKEDLIFERLEQWIWSLRNDKPPTMADVNPELAMRSLARIYGASIAGKPTIAFSSKQEHALRRIALLQAENSQHNDIIKRNEKEIEAHSVRIAERYVYLEFEALCTQMVFPSTRVPVSSKWPSSEAIIFLRIDSTVPVIQSAHLPTILLTVPVESGILNTLDSISCVLFTLTAPMVLSATTRACRFSPYCTGALMPSGNSPFRCPP